MNNMRQLGMPLLYWNRIPDQGMLVDLTTKWLWGEAAISFLAEGVLNTITDDSGNPVTVVGSVLGNAVDTIVSAPGQWDPATWFFRMPIPEHEEFLWAYQSWYQQTNPEISLGWLFSEFLPNHFPFCRRVLMRFHQEEVESSSPDAHIKGRYDDIERRFEIDVRPLNAGSSMASTPDSSYLKAHEFIRLGEMGSTGEIEWEFNDNLLSNGDFLINELHEACEKKVQHPSMTEEEKRDLPNKMAGQFISRLRQLASMLTRKGSDASAVGFPLYAALEDKSIFVGALWLVYQAEWEKIEKTETTRLDHIERMIAAPLALRLQSCILSRQSLLRKKAEVKVAAAAIMARNKSHHIGSHVTPRSKLEDLRTRVEELLLPLRKDEKYKGMPLNLLALKYISDNRDELKQMTEKEIKKRLPLSKIPTYWSHMEWMRQVHPIFCGLRDELDDYGQRKDEFVAEFSTDSLISTRAASFYREVILPFIQNTALTDSLAANEGFRYAWKPDFSMKSGLVVRCFVKIGNESKEIQPRFHPEGMPDKEATECPPYGMRFASHPGRNAVVEIPDDITDPWVALPGPVGEMAFYCILENIIRNAAKHGFRGHGQVEALEVHVILEDVDTTHYNVTIYENLTGPDNELEDIRSTMEKHFSASIITPSGQCRTEGWGAAEMKLCADLLRGVSPGEHFRHNNELKPHILEMKNLKKLGVSFQGVRENEEILRVLAYTFPLRKAWRAVFLGFSEGGAETKELEQRGFRFADGSGWATNRHIELPPACQFAVIHADLLKDLDFNNKKEAEEACKQLRAAFRRLPFRIIVCGITSKPSAEKCLKEFNVCIAPPEISSFLSIRNAASTAFKSKRTGADAHAEFLTHWLWQTWLGSLKRHPEITTEVYFHQEEDLKPTDSWAEQTEDFMKNCSSTAGLRLRMWGKNSKDGSLKCRPPEDHVDNGAEGMRIIVDRHGAFVSSNECGDLSKDDCLMIIDKNSSDFEAVYNAALAPPWVLPYELVEAGLLRVLVLDERIAQRADKFYTAMEQARPQFRKALMMKDDTPPKVRDVARRAGIEVARRLAVCIVDENKNVVRGKRLDVATREWDALELNGGNCEFKDGTAIRIYLREQTGEQTAPKIDKVKTTEQIHLIVIHQGIIDLIKNEYKVGEKELLTALSTQFWTVVESGRGIPPEIQQNGEKFLSYSLLDRVFHGGRVAKLGLIRKLMEVTRNPKS